MSVQRARAALRGQKTDCIPLLDTPLHSGWLKKHTGIDPFADVTAAVVAAVKILDVDLISSQVPTQPPSRADDKNLAGLWATDWRVKGRGPEDFLSYDPAQSRKDLPGMSLEAAAAQIRVRLEQERQWIGETTLSMGYTFTTCIHYAAEDLDWEEFLMACLTEEAQVAAMLDRFQVASHKILQAHAQAGIEVMFSHDDIAMATGTVQSPEWLRRNIIRRYPEIWKPVKDLGIPLLFATDGNFHEIAADLRRAGADGFFLDQPCMDLAMLVRQCGEDMIYYTGPTPAAMTVGSPAEVRRQIREMAQIAKHLPRFFFHLPGGYMHNMPTENVEAFYQACREYGQR